MTEVVDVVLGLVAAGQWPNFADWDTARHPAFDSDDPLTLLGKLL